MTAKNGPKHIVVDGSNIATEGRSLPSLKQLNEAVMGFMDEYPDTAITVVVDATFGHRIDKKEVKDFEAGISNNELVAPPAGAVGRGDAFVLGIADKAGATVLSNDSFQEFHADYPWLFDTGRLIGGKPVPHVGWVWVERNPVRGPVSRKATRGTGRGNSRSGGRGRSRSSEQTVRQGSPEASAPMPVPTAPPPQSESKRKTSTSKPTRRVQQSSEPVNELLPFLEFVEHHPVGTSVNGTVDSYSSHGAYIAIGASPSASADEQVRGYVPLQMMAEPVPRSAKSLMKIGESLTVVVVRFSGARRSIDCALPDMAEQAIEAAENEDDDANRDDIASSGGAVPKKPRATKVAAKKAAVKKAPVKKSAAKKSARSKPAPKKTPAKKAAPKKAATKKSAAKKSPAKKAAPKKASAKNAAKKSGTKKTAVKKVAAKKAVVKKVAAKQTPVKKASAKKLSTKRPTRKDQ